MACEAYKPTVSDVRAIITTSLATEAIASVIEDAYLMVEHCVASLSESRTKAIVKWVAAHLISSMSGSDGGKKTLTSFKLGDAQENYTQAALGEALKGTTYGQQAIALDPNGCIANLGKRKVSFTVL